MAFADSLNRGVTYGAVAASAAFASMQSLDTGMVAAAIGGIGLAITGVYWEFKRKQREDRKADHAARIERERLEVEAKIERDRLAQEAQIALDERREKAYAGRLTEQIAQLQASLEEGNRRIEDANAKLHELRNEAASAKSQFFADREELRQRLAATEAENKRLLGRLNGKIEGARAVIRENREAIDELRQYNGNGSGSSEQAIVPPGLLDPPAGATP